MLTSLVSLRQENVKKSEKSMEIVNIGRENVLYVLKVFKLYGNEAKFLVFFLELRSQCTLKKQTL